MIFRVLIPTILSVLFAVTGSPAAEPDIPNFWDEREQMTTPHAESVARIRILTTIDFPPFNYVDSSGRLAGFNIDLAEAICDALNAVDRCSIQALPWDELETALLNGEGDAIMAGLAPTREKRGKLLFSRSYMRFPARFVMSDGQQLPSISASGISGKRIGVVAGSAHEAMLRDYFPEARPVTYSRSEWIYADMKAGKLDGIFGDGMQLSFWMGSPASADCCAFSGGPYISDKYLGEGLTIVAAGDNDELINAFNFALRELQSKGVYSELYLRYFPVGFF